MNSKKGCARAREPEQHDRERQYTIRMQKRKTDTHVQNMFLGITAIARAGTAIRPLHRR